MITIARTLRACLLALLAMPLLWLCPSDARAQVDCQPEGTPSYFEFGDVGPAGATTSITVTYTCYNRASTQQSATACMFFDPMSNTPGVAPRTMISWGATTEWLQFDLYADPGHSELVGSTSSGHPPVLVEDLTLGANGRETFHISIYAELHPGQAVAVGRYYVSQMTERLFTAYRDGPTPPGATTCAACISSHGNCDRQERYVEALATGVSGCQITTSTDLDFGEVDGLAQATDGVSLISFACPVGTTWRMGLDNGRHADGETRRMSGPGGALVNYELYRDAARSQRWGNTADVDVSAGTGTGSTQTLSVYGRVPAQSGPASGNYSDTITVTLIF